MPQFVARATNPLGIVVWGNGWGDYIDATDAQAAKARAVELFLEPPCAAALAEAPKLAASMLAHQQDYHLGLIDVSVIRRRKA